MNSAASPDASPVGKAFPDTKATIDPRLVFLARASARLVMVEIGEIDVREAFDGLVEPFMALVRS
jgi:hypothetical protein